jgi:hypothetical protein
MFIRVMSRLATGLIFSAVFGVLGDTGVTQAQLLDSTARRIPVRGLVSAEPEAVSYPRFKRMDTNELIGEVPNGYVLAITDITLVGEAGGRGEENFHNFDITDDENQTAVDISRVQLVSSGAQTHPGYHYTSPVWVVRENHSLIIHNNLGPSTPTLHVYLQGYLVRADRLGL